MFTRIIRGLKPSLVSHNIVKFELSDIVRLNQKLFSKNVNKNISFQPTNGEEYKKKEPVVPKITLLSGTDLNITTLEDAQKRAKRRDLKLVKIVDIDTKTHRPVYKLMTGSEYHEEDLKQRLSKKAEKQNNPFKGEKLLMVGQNISTHDLEIHCSKIIKWLDKNYEVRIVVNGNIENIKKAENVYQLLEEKLTDYGKIVQKRQKGSDIKFQVLPLKKSTSNNDDQKNGASGNFI